VQAQTARDPVHPLALLNLIRAKTKKKKETPKKKNQKAQTQQKPPTKPKQKKKKTGTHVLGTGMGLARGMKAKIQTRLRENAGKKREERLAYRTLPTSPERKNEKKRWKSRSERKEVSSVRRGLLISGRTKRRGERGKAWRKMTCIVTQRIMISIEARWGRRLVTAERGMGIRGRRLKIVQ